MNHTIQHTLALAIALAGTYAHADTVIDWSANLDQVMFNVGQPVPTQARSLAIVHTAIYDAVNGVARKYTPYLVNETAPPGARQEAAAAQAAYTVMVALYPTQLNLLDQMLADSLQTIPGRQGKNQSIARGRAWGAYVANQILAWRSSDGFNATPEPYFGGGSPGVWRSPPTPTAADGSLPAVFPQLATLVPFAMTSPSQFRPGPPPDLTSAQYAADVNEVKVIGRFDSAVRTPVQTQLALLWQAVGPGDENRAARAVVPQGNTLVENARLFALLNITAADAIIAGFDSKYAYNLWRPFHAIRLADTDGNPETEVDPTWNSLFPPPRFQEYVSNHAVLTGSFMRMLTLLLGDEHTFTLSSSTLPGVTWTFERFSDATWQAKEARIWAGIHFRTACDVGEAAGLALAEYVVENFLLPIDRP